MYIKYYLDKRVMACLNLFSECLVGRGHYIEKEGGSEVGKRQKRNILFQFSSTLPRINCLREEVPPTQKRS